MSVCAVDWGLVVNAIAALGSIGAAMAALYIATRDRRERARERLAADEAEAKLIFTGIATSNPTTASVRQKVDERTGEEMEYDTHPRYMMWLKNESQRPILDVTVIACKMSSDPSAVAELAKSSVREIVKPGQESHAGGVKFFAPDGTRLPREKPEDERTQAWDRWPVAKELGIVGWLGFTDVDGNRWARSSEGELRRITKPSDIERLY